VSFYFFILKLSKSFPLYVPSVSSTAVDTAQAGLLYRRQHRSSQPPTPPLYRARTETFAAVTPRLIHKNLLLIERIDE
jgi:hypothetical protein